MKKVISILLSTVICISANLTAFAEFTATNAVAGIDGDVKVIIEVDGDALLATEKASQMGVAFMTSDEGKELEAENLARQADVYLAIEDEVTPDIELEHIYTIAINGFSATVPSDKISEIEKIDGVKGVHISKKYKPTLESSVGEVSLPTDIADTSSPMYTGEGQAVAVIDSEFELDHEFFETPPKNPKLTSDKVEELTGKTGVYYSEKIPFAYDYENKEQDTSNHSTCHGTHVAGIVAGKNGTYPDIVKNADGTDHTGTFSGVAPEAQLALMQVLDADGYLSDTHIGAAIQDAINLGVCAINMSIGVAYDSPANDMILKKSVDAARNAGIVVCVAAGNEGIGHTLKTSPTEFIDYGSINTPSSHANATAVASVNNINCVAYKKDSSGNIIESKYVEDIPEKGEVSFFSSRGVADNLELKPEISAPGHYIYSSVNNDNKYETMSGTSMATPHLAGVSAVMSEYLDKNEINLTNMARVNRIENMLMSTADIIYQSEGVPVSTRAQGAGLVNVKNAVATPVIITGDTNEETGLKKSKLSLGEISKEFELTFTLENLTNEAVTYNDIKLEIVTDGYINENGKNLVNETSESIEFTTLNLPETVTVDSYSTETVTVTVTVDDKDLSDIFTNGFFIDGFVILKNGSGKVSMPFTGFCGKWAKQSVYDKTMYDEGGSFLQGGINELDGTYLCTLSGESVVKLGEKADGTFDSSRIAISPNGDGRGDWLVANLRYMRSVYKLESDITRTPQQIVSNDTTVFPKYYAITSSFGDLSGKIPDGQWYYDNTATFYGGGDAEHISIPLFVDYTKPIITSVNATDAQITITAQDNHYIKAIRLVYKDTSDVLCTKEARYDSDNHGMVYTFTLSEISNFAEAVRVEVDDYALNSTAIGLSEDTGIVDSELVAYSVANKSVSMSFTNTTAEPITGDVYTAFYDADGRMIGVGSCTNETFTQDIPVTVQFGLNTAIDTAVNMKLFIWNSELAPLDTAKTYILK